MYYTHAPSQTEVEVTKVKSKIERKATATLETPQQILGTELRSTSEELRLVYLESQHYGTFKVSLELFFQLFTIHGQQRRSIFPCVFGLLPNTTEATYARFFREVFGQINQSSRTF